MFYSEYWGFVLEMLDFIMELIDYGCRMRLRGFGRSCTSARTGAGVVPPWGWHRMGTRLRAREGQVRRLSTDTHAMKCILNMMGSI